MSFQIKLLEGLNELEFGMPLKKFTSIMGEPNQTETISDADDPVTTLLLNYDNWSSSFFFEGKNNEFYLNSIDSDNVEAELFGKKIFELEPKQMIELFKNMGFDKYETATEDWGEMRLTFDDAMSDFYFENRKLISVIWGY